MTTKVPSTALVPYTPPQSIPQFIQNEAIRGQKIFASCFKDADFYGTAKLAAETACSVIFSNPQHGTKRILAGYLLNFYFVDIVDVDIRDEVTKRMVDRRMAAFYVPNELRAKYEPMPPISNWLVLRWSFTHLEIIQNQKAIFNDQLEKVKNDPIKKEDLIKNTDPEVVNYQGPAKSHYGKLVIDFCSLYTNR